MKLRDGLSWLVPFLLLVLHGCAVGQEKREVKQQDTVTVCITRTGEKYHECTCRYLRSSSISITLKDAIARGYAACSVCKPTTSEASVNEQEGLIQNTESQPEIKPAPKNSTTSRQCSGITKAGLRCRRTTTSASGKCWQHE